MRVTKFHIAREGGSRDFAAFQFTPPLGKSIVYCSILEREEAKGEGVGRGEEGGMKGSRPNGRPRVDCVALFCSPSRDSESTGRCKGDIIAGGGGGAREER